MPSKTPHSFAGSAAFARRSFTFSSRRARRSRLRAEGAYASQRARIRYSACLFCSRRPSASTGSTMRLLTNCLFSSKTGVFCSMRILSSIIAPSLASSMESKSRSDGRVDATSPFACFSTAERLSALNAFE